MRLAGGCNSAAGGNAEPGLRQRSLASHHSVNVNVNVSNLLAISESDFDNSGDPGPQAEGVNHLETPLRQLHVTHRASSCAKRGGHVKLCLKPRGARGIEPETIRRRGQLLSRPPTTGQGVPPCVPPCTAYEGVARGAPGCHRSAAGTCIVSVLTCEEIFPEA